MISLKKCNLCNHRSFFKYFTSKDIILGYEGNFNLVKCNFCGLIFLNPQLSENELAVYYPLNKYYSLSQVVPPSKFKIWILKNLYSEKNYIFNKLLFFLKPFFMTLPVVKGGRFLDVGCGSGKLMYLSKKLDMIPYGVEPMVFDRSFAKKQNLNIFNGYLKDVKYPSNYFDVIILHHVFEHVNNPTLLLKEIRRILKPGGSFVISVPNPFGIIAKIFGKYWIGWDVPRHLFNYSPAVLNRYVQKENFLNVSTRFKTNPFSILGSFLLISNKFRKKEKSLFDANFSKNKFLYLLFVPISYILTFGNLGDEIEMTLTK